ncbi:alpha/beta fold hydrolase [Marinomonas sp. A79]|uniref:Alpha/beta fold hydrolase n=1 Tax=Marinomonas vulgaris TaxID=2823372 RepID=A0ABS5HEN0_9GAMM|nr:alpha/beta fold hydrolase [Marinomonas vulgaris]MBR7889909.1 alpha/beta fold hydrolase [Marinomonas vulgaris]
MNFLFVLAVILLACVVIFMLAIHVGFRAPRISNTETPETKLGVAYSTVFVPTKNAKKLSTWFLPVHESEVTVVILHGWGSNAGMMLPLASPFHAAGMNVLLFDARSHGGSESDTFSSLPRFAEDTQSVVDWLKKTHPMASQKIVLLGHSVGGAAVLLASSRTNDVAAVISISAFAHPTWMMQRYLKSVHLPSIMRPSILRYVEWVIGSRFNDIAPINTIRSVKCPVLLVHGNVDRVVPIEDSRAIIADGHLSHVSLIEVDGAGHDSVDNIESHSQKLIDFLIKEKIVN